MSSLGQRFATGTVLVLLVLAALFALPPRGWGVAVLGVVGLAALEWSRLAGFTATRSMLFTGGMLAIGVALLFGPGAPSGAAGFTDGVVLAVCGLATAFWILVAAPWVVQRWAARAPLAMALAGLVALTGALVALVELHAHSPWLLLAAMATVWVADTAAYFAGRRFGRRKLAPEVSPGKTWEGVFGALVAVAVYAVALVPLARDAGWVGPTGLAAVAVWIAFAVALAAVSIVGDLYESLLKRRAGVKDSGGLLPGHGGVLDRTDALIAAMPPAALAAHVFLRH